MDDGRGHGSGQQDLTRVVRLRSKTRRLADAPAAPNCALATSVSAARLYDAGLVMCARLSTAVYTTQFRIATRFRRPAGSECSVSSRLFDAITIRSRRRSGCRWIPRARHVDTRAFPLMLAKDGRPLSSAARHLDNRANQRQRGLGR